MALRISKTNRTLLSTMILSAKVTAQEDTLAFAAYRENRDGEGLYDAMLEADLHARITQVALELAIGEPEAGALDFLQRHRSNTRANVALWRLKELGIISDEQYYSEVA